MTRRTKDLSPPPPLPPPPIFSGPPSFTSSNPGGQNPCNNSRRSTSLTFNELKKMATKSTRLAQLRKKSRRGIPSSSSSSTKTAASFSSTISDDASVQSSKSAKSTSSCKSDFVVHMRSRLKAGSSSSSSCSAPDPRFRINNPHQIIQDLKKTHNNNVTATNDPGTTKPSLEPYVGKLERFELFSTHQAYYLVACDKHNVSYRVLRMDRTLIEQPEPRRRNFTGMGAFGGNDERGHDSRHHRRSSSEPPHHGTTSHDDHMSLRRQNTMQETNDVDFDEPRDPRMSKPESPQPPEQPPAELPPKSTFRRLPEFCIEDPHVYTQIEVQEMLDMIHDGNKTVGGLRPVAKAYGIVGFIRFLDCYYLTLITKRAKVGSVGTNSVYSIKSTETFPLKPAERRTPNAESNTNPADPSSMLLNMWNRGKRSVGLGLTNREIAELRYQGLYQVIDLTKNFFFSYTYDMTRSLQENFLAMTSQPFPPPPFKDMYAWNFFLTRELEDCTSSLTSSYWVLPIVHGAFIQRKMNDYGRSLNLTLLARRSRHFAGTRYLKRGVSDRGKVANDVEHEQILHDETNSAASETFSSYLQMRGSIPTYWTQESSVTMPKPPIVLNRVDPTYQATQAHFEDLLKRYGSPVVVLDLVKQSEKREREVIVGNEYRHAIDYLNSYIDDEHKIRYCALDYSHISKHRNLNVSTSLNEVATWAVNQTGFFCSAPRWKIVEEGKVEPFDEKGTAAIISQQLGVPVFPMEQKGVLRTNCIDCLDRTNVAQFSAGVEALGQQLVVMGIRSSGKLDPSSNIVRALIDMYVEIGDHIALQYGGSEAHKKGASVGPASNVQPSMGKHKELLTSIRRYYSNTFTDRLKQDAMNLFLGYYIPSRHTIPLWDLENDYYLHNFHVRSGGSLQSMTAYERIFAVDWSDEEEDDGDEDEQMDRSHDAASASLSSPQIKPKRKPRKLHTRGESLTLTGIGEDVTPAEAKAERDIRMNRVRRRCNAQNDALSVWWKVAIQSYIQQRMWMQLGRGPSEALLPPRFERFYQPPKLAQFDKIFTRSWATPMRLSHSAQHKESADDVTVSSSHLQRTSEMSPLKSNRFFPKGEYGEEEEEEDSDEDDGYQTLSGFVCQFGFKATTGPTLNHFIKPHENPGEFGCRQKGSEEEEKKVPSGDEGGNYLGNLNHRSVPCQEYLQYANYPQQPDTFSRSFRSTAHQEFSKSLYETNLGSDDVEGIRKLAESAHIGSLIQSGPYRGLPQDESAVEVTSVIHEQFNALSSMQERGEGRRAGFLAVDQALKRRGMDTSGVKEEILNGWDGFARADEAYREIIDTSSLGWRRSDLTTESSMRLYCSFYHNSTTLSRSQMTYMLGKKLPSDSSSRRKLESSNTPRNGSVFDRNETPYRQCASSACKDIDIKVLFSPSQVFSAENRNRPLQPGFEQINEDLFARKDNKFMVFNGAAVDCWQMQPITRVGGIEADILIR